MMLRLFRTAALMIGLALLAACSDKETATPASTPAAEAGHEEGGDHDEHGEGEEGAAPIRMDEAALKAAGIVIAPVVASALSEELRAPGEVVDSAYGTTLITPRVDAIVVRRHAKLGDEVTQGTPLVTLSSVEVAQAQGTLRIAEQDWKRVQELGRDAVSGRRYTESQVAVEQARAAAQAYGIAGASAGKANGEFTLSAPHAGRITEDAFVVGERIEPGRTLFRLVDESVVWVDATMPAENANRIAVGSQAQIVLGETSNDRHRAAARASHVGGHAQCARAGRGAQRRRPPARRRLRRGVPRCRRRPRGCCPSGTGRSHRRAGAARGRDRGVSPSGRRHARARSRCAPGMSSAIAPLVLEGLDLPAIALWSRARTPSRRRS
jgi:multidrug efflux pump subunit AcrA (membrane-fusion protein)